jgi:hypothetical protein
MGLLVLGLAAGTAVVYGASLQQYHGYAWADAVCAAAPYLCSSPSWLAMLTIVTAVLYFYKVSLDS